MHKLDEGIHIGDNAIAMSMLNFSEGSNGIPALLTSEIKGRNTLELALYMLSCRETFERQKMDIKALQREHQANKRALDPKACVACSPVCELRSSY